MKICILEAQIPPVIFHSFCSHYGALFENMFNLLNQSIKFSFYRVIDGVYPDENEKFDCFLITGSREDSFSDVNWVKDLRAFICKEIAKGSKFIGACFGHQLLALCLGGKVARSKKGLGLGVHTYQIKKTFFMEDDLKEINILVYHQDQITYLPENIAIFASNDFCPVAGFVYKKQVLGIQGHSEYSKDYVLKLLEIYHGQYIKDQSDKFKLNMQKPVIHRKIIAQWMLNFIKG